MLTLKPMDWTQLPDINDVKPLGDDDVECLAEIREVLRKHKAISRFGVHLLHSHFEIRPDEVLVESVDEERREQRLSPMKKALVSETVIATSWQLADSEISSTSMCVVRTVCFPMPDRRHQPAPQHNYAPDT